MKNRDKTHRSTISKKFIIAIAIIYATLILATAISFHYITNRNTDILSKAVNANTQDTLIGKVDTIVDRLSYRKAESINEIKIFLKEHCTEENDFLYAIIYSKTGDENFFKVRDTIKINREMNIAVEKNAVVQERKETNYLKKGQFNPVIDHNIYTNKKQIWQNVYYPYKSGRKDLVLQFMISSSRTYLAMDTYASSLKRIRIFIMIITIILVIAVFIVTYIFINNYSLLITNLSHFMTEAAKGNLDIHLNTISDDELDQLATSFNSLIEEMKDMKDRPITESISQGDLFKKGVGFLKDKAFDNAISVFKTIIALDSGGFGCYFNLGIAYAKIKQYNLSMEMFQRASAMNPSYELTKKYIEKVTKLQTLHD